MLSVKRVLAASAVINDSRLDLRLDTGGRGVNTSARGLVHPSNSKGSFSFLEAYILPSHPRLYELWIF